jgi:hypothetical protein
VSSQQIHLALEPSSTLHIPITLEEHGIEGITLAVNKLAVFAIEIATNVSSRQVHLAISGETAIAVHVPLDPDSPGIEGIDIGIGGNLIRTSFAHSLDQASIRVREYAATTIKYALDIGICQAYLANSRETVITVHVAFNSEPVSTESGDIAIRRELSPHTIERVTNMGTDEAYLAIGLEPFAAVHTSLNGEPGSVESGAMSIRKLASLAVECTINVGAN